tara:strand:- start:272 stop:484 length:213 start_codon:yes stop_codon:yes gene_type:complete
MIDLQHIHEGNEGMENLKQIEELENKVSYSIKELREILKVYHYNSDGYMAHISKDVVTSLENLLGSLLKK